MVKAKKKNLSEFTQQKRISYTVKQLNPFEVHINREKQKVLGRKSKNDRGLPGVSKAKAINKRKRSLLLEYKLKNKDNVFLDKRIGEKNSAMTIEDKAVARFTMEHVKAYKKKNIYNLNDDEVLTHRGQTLEEIEKFDDPKSDDEFSNDENTSGKLDKNFVEEANFGGGVLSKSNSTLSRKDLIEQLIAESKKRKAEKQKLREQTINLTEKLDSEWKDLLPIISVSKKTDEDAVEIAKADAYDIALQELKFEARGNPSEKLKSEEEIFREEKEKLEALEADRLARMKGYVFNTNVHKHKSADDLDDNFTMEPIVENEKNQDNITTNDTSDDNTEDSDIDNDDTVDIVSNDKKEEKTISNIEIAKNEMTCTQSSNTKDHIDLEDKNLESESSDDQDSEDSLLDLKISESSSESETENIEKHVKFANNLIGNYKQTNQSDQTGCLKPILKQVNNITHVENSSEYIKNKEQVREIKKDLLKQTECMDKMQEELPYAYNVPENFEELEKLLENQSPEYQSIIIDRIIKCNHWSLDGRNKEKLSNLFVYLLQYINNCACATKVDDLIKCFQIFNGLCPYLYDLAQMNAENAKYCIQEIIKEKHDKFEKNKRRYPNIDTLIFFKLVSLLFPTSDFRHPIVTPCLIFMSQILLRSHIRNRKDVAKGLFICTLILEYTILSKRFAPSVINFLQGIIYAVSPNILTQKMKVIPTFKAARNLLEINDRQIDSEIDLNGKLMNASDLSSEDTDDKFRIRALLTAINLIIEFKKQLQELEAAYSIFEPILKLLKINKFKQCSSNVRKHIKKLRTELEILQSKKLEYIVLEKKRPKPLKMYEPKIMTVYDGKQHKPMSKEKAEREKLLHKYKKEMKGAIREIRRDRAFLAKVQISQQIKSDIERKRKVKEIFGEAADQQSELNKMKRKK